MLIVKDPHTAKATVPVEDEDEQLCFCLVPTAAVSSTY